MIVGIYSAFLLNSILMGLLVAENIGKGATHDLWSVNTDYEAYQESSISDMPGEKAST